MVPLLTEIISFIASDEYIGAQDDTLRKLKELLAHVEGHVGLLHGLQVEDQNVGYMILLWQSETHYEAYIDSEQYSDVQENLLRAVDDTRYNSVLTELRKEGSAAVSGLELAVVTLAEDKSGEDISELPGKLVTEDQEMVISAEWPYPLGQAGRPVLVLGWITSEARQEITDNVVEAVVKIFSSSLQMSDIKIVHCSCRAIQ